MSSVCTKSCFLDGVDWKISIVHKKIKKIKKGIVNNGKGTYNKTQLVQPFSHYSKRMLFLKASMQTIAPFVQGWLIDDCSLLKSNFEY
ncbi:hypothetical protein JCM9157_2360 [Halalkalibacter akibai JCM 9157]|uniref:Uncharacterized protein n=1 Tax=Halalkalibacter akibai (strain ATCC 43226 / DSM 21942 / CIP 109018 / JCM 9157 / 1139) TaxID=1236973 RepID=W4QSY7_HALA3|nr:hypothetical protein JCM9157_2360 [Halalkalibacter akibai JCM 9157]